MLTLSVTAPFNIEINEKEKWHDIPIIPPQIKDKPTTDTAVNLGTDIIEKNDLSNEVHNRVDVPVKLRKKNDANTFLQKLINEQKILVRNGRWKSRVYLNLLQ